MLPVNARRIDYTDGTSDETLGTPARKTGVRGVIYWHNEPYRTLDYGNSTYTLDTVDLEGETESDETYEAWRTGVHTETHRNKPPYARVTHAALQIPATSASIAFVVWAEVELASTYVQVMWAEIETQAPAAAWVTWAELQVGS